MVGLNKWPAIISAALSLFGSGADLMSDRHPDGVVQRHAEKGKMIGMAVMRLMEPPRVSVSRYSTILFHTIIYLYYYIFIILFYYSLLYFYFISTILFISIILFYYYYFILFLFYYFILFPLFLFSIFLNT